MDFKYELNQETNCVVLDIVIRGKIIARRYHETNRGYKITYTIEFKFKDGVDHVENDESMLNCVQNKLLGRIEKDV